MGKITRRSVVCRKRLSHHAMTFANTFAKGSEAELSTGIPLNSSFTIELFVKVPHIIQTHTWVEIFQLGYDSSDVFNLALHTTDGYSMNFYFSHNNYGDGIVLGKRHKFTITYSGASAESQEIRLYKDGVYIYSTYGTLRSPINEPFLLGSGHSDWNNDALEAEIDNVGFYDYMKSDAVIQSESSRKPRKGDYGLVRLYRGRSKNDVVREVIQGAHGTFYENRNMVVFDNPTGYGTWLDLGIPFPTDQDMTIEFFFTKTGDNGRQDWHTLFTFEPRTSTSMSLGYTKINGQVGWDTFNNLIESGRNKYVVTRSTDNVLKVYRNGALIHTTTVIVPILGKQLTFGNYNMPGDNSAILGNIEHIGIYTKVKDATTIAAQATSIPEMMEEGILRHYPGEVNGSVLVEKISGDHGTIHYT